MSHTSQVLTLSYDERCDLAAAIRAQLNLLTADQILIEKHRLNADAVKKQISRNLALLERVLHEVDELSQADIDNAAAEAARR